MSRALQLPLLLDAITRGHHRRRRGRGRSAGGGAMNALDIAST
jgi:hypothetical protein